MYSGSVDAQPDADSRSKTSRRFARTSAGMPGASSRRRRRSSPSASPASAPSHRLTSRAVTRSRSSVLSPVFWPSATFLQMVFDAPGCLSDARCTRVAPDDLPQRAVRDPDRRGRQTRSPVLRRDEVRSGDGDLLGLGVARQLDDLEAVPQGRRDPGPLVGGRDEEDLRQVERQLGERVAETALLFRIEHFEEHRGRRGPDLVHLVQHDDRVSVPDPPELAEDRAGLRPVPRAVVPPYRAGYGLRVLERGSFDFELGFDAQRRESATVGEASNGFLGRATLGW